MGRATRTLLLVALVAVAGVVTGTGAFTAVTADRAAAVDVAGDESAWLRLVPHDGPNGAYARLVDGQLTLDVTDANPNVDAANGPIRGGAGVNANAQVRADDVFNVTNQGTQPVAVWLTHDGDAVEFYAPADGHGSLDGPDAAVVLDVGQSVAVGFAVDTAAAAAGDRLLDGVTVHADADAAAAAAGGGGALTARIDVSPPAPVAGENVTLDASASLAPAGVSAYEWRYQRPVARRYREAYWAWSTDENGTRVRVRRYRWAWRLVTEWQNATGPTVTTTYAGAGDYAVELTVTDADGNVGTATATVPVRAETAP
ncbi:MAG: DUF1102 domain-containing protein [Halobacteriaceae archaeon]